MKGTVILAKHDIGIGIFVSGTQDPAIIHRTISEGLIGSGDFSATPLNLFVHDVGRITAASEAGLFNGTTLRFEFEVSALAGAYQIQFGGISATVGARGAFWVDAQSLDLLRMEQHDVGIPLEMNVRDIVTTIAYGRTRIGSSNPLMPQPPPPAPPPRRFR